jgi:hypothetical protein
LRCNLNALIDARKCVGQMSANREATPIFLTISRGSHGELFLNLLSHALDRVSCHLS